MKRKSALSFLHAFLCIPLLASCAPAREPGGAAAPMQPDPSACDVVEPRAVLDEAWAAWGEGNIDEARDATSGLLACGSNDEALHLAVLTSFVKGRFAAALEAYRALPASYARRSELDGVAVDALGHLGRYQEALDLALDRRLGDATTTPLRLRAEAPMTATLGDVTTAPFVESDSLTPFMPGFEVELLGRKLLARFDTGADFVVMSPRTAADLGVETRCAGVGKIGTTSAKTCFGTLRSLKIGSAQLANVPVVTLEGLPLAEPILGTNIFERFLTTIDYPKARLVFSPRGDDGSARRHLEALGSNRTTLPFYVWSDHFMFARGSLGEHEALNFFVDSGLVAIAPDGTQAAFEATTTALASWGVVSDEKDRRAFVPLAAELGLGTLRQAGLRAHSVSRGPVTQLGGVRIDGLISHAFLKGYAWTIDFETMQYAFSR